MFRSNDFLPGVKKHRGGYGINIVVNGLEDLGVTEVNINGPESSVRSEAPATVRVVVPMEGINGVANPINVFTSADLGYVSSDPKGRAAREITRNFFVQDLIFSHNEKGRAVYVPGQSFRFIATPEGGKWNLRAGGNFSRAKREFVDARA